MGKGGGVPGSCISVCVGVNPLLKLGRTPLLMWVVHSRHWLAGRFTIDI